MGHISDISRDQIGVKSPNRIGPPAQASTGPGQNSDLRPFSCQFTPEFSSELGTYAPILPPDPARTSGVIHGGPALPRGRPGPPSSIIQNSSFGSPSADHFQPSGSSRPSCHGLRSAPGSSPEACLEFSGATNVTHLSCLSQRSFSIQTLLSRFRYRFPSCHLVTLMVRASGRGCVARGQWDPFSQAPHHDQGTPCFIRISLIRHLAYPPPRFVHCSLCPRHPGSFPFFSTYIYTSRVQR